MFCLFKQKTSYEMRISDWSSDVCSSDLCDGPEADACGGDSASPKRAAIIAAATDLFTHSGYGAVSMDAIAAKAGVSKRTVYSHFPGKDVLFAAVMTRHCGTVSGVAGWELDPEVEPREMLTDRGRRFLTLFTRSEEHTSELQSLMRISYAVFCLNTKRKDNRQMILSGELT